MNEAHAQTVELVDAGTKAFGTVADKAGAETAVMGLMVALCVVVIVMLYRRLEKRDAEIADLKVQCAKELAAAEVAAAASAEARVQIAWQRVAEIFASTKTLFENVAVSNDKVAGTLKSLELTLATKGITAK